MDSFAEQVIAITGAGSGIGRALAEELALRGATVALSDINERELDRTVNRCQHLGAQTSAMVVDVSDQTAMEKWAVDVVGAHGAVNMIVNNAGVALISNLAESDREDIEWLMSINYWGVVHGTMAFLPHLEASGQGRIVNLSSVFGLISVPSQAAYNSAKFAVRGFSDALRMELAIAGSPVSVTTVHPGGIDTNIVRSARFAGDTSGLITTEQFQRIAGTSPRRAARIILRGLERNRRRILVGKDAVVIDALSRLPIGVYERAVVTAQRRRNLQSRRG